MIEEQTNQENKTIVLTIDETGKAIFITRGMTSKETIYWLDWAHHKKMIEEQTREQQIIFKQ